jgi:hypothetical protein
MASVCTSVAKNIADRLLGPYGHAIQEIRERAKGFDQKPDFIQERQSNVRSQLN